MRRLAITTGLLILLALGANGCATARPSSTPREPSPLPRSAANPGGGSNSNARGQAQAQTTSHRQLQARLMAFADRYLNRISEAVDRIEAQNPTADCRIAAHSTKYYPSLTVLSLACESEPESALLDLLVVVTLERMVWEGAWSEEVFGDQAPILTKAQLDIEADIWNVAATVMTPEQIQETRELIEQWRQENPERRYVSSTRFDDFAAQRARRPDSSLRQGFLAPVSDAARAIEQTRLMAERALFLSTRMPVILQWQAELLSHQLLAKTEVQAFLSYSNAVSGAADSFASAANQFAEAAQGIPDKFAEQRAAFMRDVESQQAETRQTLEEVRASLNEAAQLMTQVEKVVAQANPLVESAGHIVVSADATLASADRLAARFEKWQEAAAASGAEPGRPFDVREYTQAAERLTGVLKELNQALATTEEMLASPARAGLVQHIDEIIKNGVAQSGQEARSSINKLFWRGALLIIFACAGVILAGWIRNMVVNRPKSTSATRSVSMASDSR